jgi:hypothetical protein
VMRTCARCATSTRSTPPAPPARATSNSPLPPALAELKVLADAACARGGPSRPSAPITAQEAKARRRPRPGPTAARS